MLTPSSITELCPALDMTKSQRVGKSGRVFDHLDALSTPNNLRTLHALMMELQPARTLEIGLCMGGSALVFCASHKKLGHSGQAQHVALDPFQTTTWDSCGVLAVERSGLEPYLDFREAYSALELPKMVECGDQFGLIYIDGSHLFEDVFLDAYFASRLLTENGVVAFDDSTDPQVAKVLRFLRKNCSGLRELNLGPFRGEHNGLAYAVGRWLGKVQLTAFQRIGPIEREWDANFQSF
jgi:predicted O-methyltransferase YrrM